MNVSDIARALADCGDGIEVKADGHPIIAAQIEGTDPRVLNLVSQPAAVRVPEDGAVDTSGGTLPLEETTGGEANVPAEPPVADAPDASGESLI